MAGRPPLPIGSYGQIRTRRVRPGAVRAFAQFRDLDGRTRQVSATGTSEPAAERALRAKLAERNTATVGADITPDTKFRDTAERFLEEIAAAVQAGTRSPGTLGQYRSLSDRHVLPALGALRLRECTTGRVDRVLALIAERAGAPTAKSCRTVISGVLRFAARHDAVTTNATRGTRAISTKPRHKPRALTPAECGRWLARLAADEQAVRRDLIDLTGFMLAVGCRIGEALAVAWDDVDLDVGTVRIDWTVCRVKGEPLFRKRVKTDAGFRTLRLPVFAVSMLRHRAAELYVLATGTLPGPAEPAVGGTTVVALDASDPAGSAYEPDLSGVDVAAAVARLGDSPVFPDTRGGWRDPSNTRRALRQARGTEEFAWVTSHVFRKTAATILDEAGLTAAAPRGATGGCTRPPCARRRPGGWRSAPSCRRRLALTPPQKPAPGILRHATPVAVLVVRQRVFEALRPHVATRAHPLRVHGGTGLLREERLRVGARTRREILPAKLIGRPEHRRPGRAPIMLSGQEIERAQVPRLPQGAGLAVEVNHAAALLSYDLTGIRRCR
jgi:integrase